MSVRLSRAQLTGLDSSHVAPLEDGSRHCLYPGAASAFRALSDQARREGGFKLSIQSAYRSHARQLRIWNAKACGELPALDDDERPVDLAALSPERRLDILLRFSALPGASRHHWGSDADVYDAAALEEGAAVRLTLDEARGVFCRLHEWLDECIAKGDSHGFYRPYAHDQGGVFCEPWHLSWRPLAQDCERAYSESTMRWALNSVPDLQLRETALERCSELYKRYVASAFMR